MTKPKEKKSDIALTASASISTPSPTAFVSAPAVTALQKSAVGDIGSDESIPRESCCCEIALFIDHYRRHICHHCGGENSEAVWMGTLSDSMSVLVGHPSEIAVISSDDTVGNREGMVPRLQMLARKHGYTYCEVRNYSASDPFDYVPLYGGPLPLLSPTS